MKRIRLSQGKFAMVDDKDAKPVRELKWAYLHDGPREYAFHYFKVKNKRRSIGLGRFLLNPPPGMFVDHINGNGLDNRRKNIRIVTPSQNQMNRRKHKQTISGFKGVCFDKGSKKWAASIRVNGKSITLGRYRSKTRAAANYNRAAKRFFGKHAHLNKLAYHPNVSMTRMNFGVERLHLPTEKIHGGKSWL